MVMRTEDDRNQLWLGGLRILGPLMNLVATMASTILVEEAREEDVAQAKLGDVFCWFPFAKWSSYER